MLIHVVAWRVTLYKNKPKFQRWPGKKKESSPPNGVGSTLRLRSGGPILLQLLFTCKVQGAPRFPLHLFHSPLHQTVKRGPSCHHVLSSHIFPYTLGSGKESWTWCDLGQLLASMTFSYQWNGDKKSRDMTKLLSELKDISKCFANWKILYKYQVRLIRADPCGAGE